MFALGTTRIRASFCVLLRKALKKKSPRQVSAGMAVSVPSVLVLSKALIKPLFSLPGRY
ncbi:hypothetical protein D3C72_2336390 [compost metagenome]